MSTLTLTTLRMPAADLGPESPLASLKPYGNASTIEHIQKQPTPPYPDKGKENLVLPYRIQGGYDRNRRPRDFRVAVLENDMLKATFLLEMGGRLWSLIDKKAGRELLYVNPVFQPANLAIRNAWFTGGVEWNCGLFGHTVTTCEPLFAAKVIGDDGEPILRLYEWERARQVPLQIDFRLSDKLPFLFSHVRLVNPHPYITPMYWWSNIAVPEKAGSRVLAPADSAYRHNYTGAIVDTSLPIVNGIDATYVSEVPNAADLYFHIPDGHRPWIASIDSDGEGFVHVSTERLRGRKLFNWGNGVGGKRWQEFLSIPGEAYLEIQGGLARTQSEYVMMPARAVWNWGEAFGPMRVDPAEAHGEWSEAWKAVERRIDQAMPPAVVAEEWASLESAIDKPPVEILQKASGWGALESMRRAAEHEPPFAGNALPFRADTLGPLQAPWKALLENGELPNADPSNDPGAFMVQNEWRTLLEDAVKNHRGEHWRSWYHLGVMRHRAGDIDGATAAWETSIERRPSAWAYRNLAQLALDAGDFDHSCTLLMKAVSLAPACIPLIRECCELLLDRRRADDVLRVLDDAAPEVQSLGRIRMFRVRAALALGDPAEAERFYSAGVRVDDIREGEISVTDIWYDWQTLQRAIDTGIKPTPELLSQIRAELSPPSDYDFRLNPAHESNESSALVMAVPPV